MQFIQLSVTQAHILGLDSQGNIWWRRWDKKGWFKMPLPDDFSTAPSVPVVPTGSTTTPTPVNAGPAIVKMIVPENIPAAPAPTTGEVIHKDPA